MQKITRRLFLRKSAAAGAAVAVAAPGAAVVATPAIMEAVTLSPVEKFNAAVDALKAAAMEMDPTMREWTVGYAADPHKPCRLVITAFDNPDGDGPLLADDVTGTTAYADWEKRRAQS